MFAHLSTLFGNIAAPQKAPDATPSLEQQGFSDIFNSLDVDQRSVPLPSAETVDGAVVSGEEKQTVETPQVAPPDDSKVIADQPRYLEKPRPDSNVVSLVPQRTDGSDKPRKTIEATEALWTIASSTQLRAPSPQQEVEKRQGSSPSPALPLTETKGNIPAKPETEVPKKFEKAPESGTDAADHPVSQDKKPSVGVRQTKAETALPTGDTGGATKKPNLGEHNGAFEIEPLASEKTKLKKVEVFNRNSKPLETKIEKPNQAKHENFSSRNSDADNIQTSHNSSEKSVAKKGTAPARTDFQPPKEYTLTSAKDTTDVSAKLSVGLDQDGKPSISTKHQSSENKVTIDKYPLAEGRQVGPKKEQHAETAHRIANPQAIDNKHIRVMPETARRFTGQTKNLEIRETKGPSDRSKVKHRFVERTFEKYEMPKTTNSKNIPKIEDVEISKTSLNTSNKILEENELYLPPPETQRSSNRPLPQVAKFQMNQVHQGGALSSGFGQLTNTDFQSAVGMDADLSSEFAPSPVESKTSFQSTIVSPSIHNRSEAQNVVRQVVEVIPRLSDKAVELRLNPEELGSVRLQLVQSETGVSVHIHAERPETLDLLKRHVDQLARDLGQGGHNPEGFTFSGGSDQRSPREGNSSSRDDQPLAPDAETKNRNVPEATGIDIRL